MAAQASIEARFPVLDWRVGAIPIWPLVRVRWMFAEWSRLYADPGSKAAWLSGLTRTKNLFTGPLAAWRAAHADRVPDPAATLSRTAGHDIVLLSDGVSFSKLGEHWFERFCDPLIASARMRGLACALWTPGHNRRLPRATPSRFIQPAIDRANIRGALAARLNSPDLHLPELQDVRAFLASAGFESSSLHPAQIASDGKRLRALADLFGAMLRVEHPRLACIVGYYGIEGMAFVLAAHECNVPVVDLQHGVQGDMHPAYAAWPRPPSGRHALLPSHFWVWSNWERDVIERWSRGTGHQAIVGGNPWMDLWMDGSAWPGVEDARTRAQVLKRVAGNRPVVLVTLQFGLSMAEQLAPLAQLVASAADRLAFWVRLHPVMLERRGEVSATLAARGATADMFVLDEPSDLPLQALLQQASVHLTHSSSAIIEAAQFGVRSVVTSKYGEELFAPLYEAGWAVTETGEADALANTLLRLSARSAAVTRPATTLTHTLDALLDGFAQQSNRRKHV